MKNKRVDIISEESENKVEEKLPKEKKRGVVGESLKQCPLVFMMILSSAVFSISGGIYSYAKEGKIAISMEKPMFASLTSITNELTSGDEANPYEFAEGEMDALLEEITKDIPENNGIVEQEDLNEEEETGYVTEFVKQKKVEVDSPYYSDPGLKALTTAYPYDTVGDEYFDDAVFIGDSRIEGLSLYSSIRNATYYAKQGTTIYKIMGEKIAEIEVDGKKKKVTVARALKEKKYAKIYLMLGINELGYKTTEDFGAEYKKVVNVIRKIQPEAKIFILSVMNVTEEYHNGAGKEVYNNTNINSKNVEIAKIADGKNVFYLDVNDAVCNKKGFVKKEYAWDGIHLKAEYYSLLDEYFKCHAIENNIQKEEETTVKKPGNEKETSEKEETSKNKTNENKEVNSTIEESNEELSTNTIEETTKNRKKTKK